MGTYSHSQRSRVHWASGKLGTLLPEYSTPNCVSADAHAFRPGRMRTPRNNPNLCEFLSARSARAICDGFLCIGALISVAPGRWLQRREFSLLVSLNTLRRDQLRAGGGLSEIRSGIFGLCLNAVGQWFRCIDGVYSRRFSASILPGVKSFFGDLACTVAISAFEPCDLRYSAPDFPMAATNRAFHHVFVLLFVRLNHRLFPKGVLAALNWRISTRSPPRIVSCNSLKPRSPLSIQSAPIPWWSLEICFETYWRW